MLQNLIYALIQIAHNFGAAAVVGFSVAGLWLRERPIARRLVLLVAVAWALQAITGALFGATSYHFYGHFPDIHGIAVDALFVKAGCAVAGFLLAGVAYCWWGCAQRHALTVWLMLCLLAATALSAAAFLRWFS